MAEGRRDVKFFDSKLQVLIDEVHSISQSVSAVGVVQRSPTDCKRNG